MVLLFDIGDNFCDFLFAYSSTNSFLKKKRSTRTGKNVLTKGAKAYRLKQIHFQKLGKSVEYLIFVRFDYS